MNDLHWIGPSVLKRRHELGLTQTALSRLAGVSRATLNGLERGNLANLSLGRLGQLLQVIGLRLQWEPRERLSDRFLAMAAQLCSVSYINTLAQGELATALATGKIPKQYKAHFITLVDEIPFQVIVGAVEATSQQFATPPAKVWRHLRQWARDFQSPRKEWLELQR